MNIFVDLRLRGIHLYTYSSPISVVLYILYAANVNQRLLIESMADEPPSKVDTDDEFCLLSAPPGT